MKGLTPHEQALRGEDGGHRAQIIQGLHDAARWLEANPGIPVPFDITIQYTASGCGEVDRIAAEAGEDINEHGGFYETQQRHFGPVGYKAVAISGDVMTAWDEAMQVFHGAQTEAAVAA